MALTTKNRSMIREGETSLNDRMRAVQQAVSKAYNQGPGDYCYVEVVFDDYVILCKSSKLWKVPYTLAEDGTVTLNGEPVQVQVTYTPVKGTKEAADGYVFGPMADGGESDGQVLESEAKPTGKKWGVLIIQEGLSKNRNRYQRKVLQEAAPLYEGRQVYLDHDEGGRRFGRSTKDLAGFLKDVQPVLMAATKEANAAGIFGLAATMVITKQAVRSELLDAWDEGNANLMGLSHDAAAESVVVMDPAGAFLDVTRIESVKSVDLVTNPAAGGRVLRLVASDTVAPTLKEDEAMLNKLIKAIRESKNTALIAKLDALGQNPTEDQILALHAEALATPAPAPAPAADPAAPAPAPVKEAVTVPAPAPAPAQPVLSLQEALELRQDSINLFLENTLAGVTLQPPVKDMLRQRFSGRITEATQLGTLPTKKEVLDAVQEQVALFGKLAEMGGIAMPAVGRPSIQMGAGRTEKVTEALDAFFGVKEDGKDANGNPKYKVAEQAMMSFRSLYVDITGDQKITGRVSEAVRLRESLDTSSFDQILGDSITRRMLAEYAMSDQAAWRGTIAQVVPVSDFRTQRRLRFGGYPNLSTVSQGAPYPALTSPTDEEATYAPAKRGGTEQITMEMIVNDDVGAVRRIPTRLARAASQTLYEFVFDFLRLNSAIYDTVALANAAHGSNISTTALSSSQLSAARNAMKKQTDMSNGKRLGLSAKFLFLPTDLEELGFQLTTAERMLPDSSLAAAAAPAAPNFIRKIGITPVTVDYWTDANDWWLTASVDQTPMIEIGFLGGREEPELFVQDVPNQGSMFSNDQITYKIRHTYGGGVMDYRGFFGGIVA